jgi:hypothetical protein
MKHNQTEEAYPNDAYGNNNEGGLKIMKAV